MEENGISKEEVKKLGQLARIGIEENEIGDFQHDLERILDFVSVLKKADVSRGVEGNDGAANVFRNDTPSHKPGEYAEELVKQAADAKGGFIKVKKIL